MHDGKLAEVLIQRDQDLGIPERVREHLVVTRIARPIGSRLDVVSDGAEPLVSPAPDTTVKKNLHTLTLSQCGFDAFVTDQTPGIDKASADIVGFEPGIALQDGLRRVPGRQHAEDVLNRETMPANDGLAAEDRGVRRDASDQLVLAERKIVAHIGYQILTQLPPGTRSERLPVRAINGVQTSAREFDQTSWAMVRGANLRE